MRVSGGDPEFLPVPKATGHLPEHVFYLSPDAGPKPVAVRFLPDFVTGPDAPESGIGRFSHVGKISGLAVG